MSVAPSFLGPNHVQFDDILNVLKRLPEFIDAIGRLSGFEETLSITTQEGHKITVKQEARDLLKSSGWIPAEAAHQLCMTPGAFSQIVRPNSPVKPSKTTLRLFRLLVELKETGKIVMLPAQPPSQTPVEKWESDLFAQLRTLDPKVRRPLLQAFVTILQAKQSPANAPQPRNASR